MLTFYRAAHVGCHRLLCAGNDLASFKWGSTNACLEDEEGNPLFDRTGVDEILETLLRRDRPGIPLRDRAPGRPLANSSTYVDALGSMPG